MKTDKKRSRLKKTAVTSISLGAQQAWTAFFAGKPPPVSADVDSVARLKHVPFLRHDADKAKLAFSAIFVLVLYTCRHISIGTGLHGGIGAVHVQGAMAF